MSIERVDPECRQALLAFREGARSGPDPSIADRRAMVSAIETQLAAAAPVRDNVVTEERTIPGPEGNAIPIRIYRPTDASGPAPGIYYIHGGAMMLGGLEGVQPRAEGQG